MRNFLLGTLLTISVSTMSAGIIVTAEAPGATQTSVANTTTVNFNALPTGAFSGSTAIGTYSSGGSIVAPDQYSGDGSKYLSVGEQSGHTSYTLTFNGAQSFFGLLWDAMDSRNSLSFYNGSTLLGTYDSASFGSLSSLYKGNPSSGKDATENFVYLDFSGTSGTKFTSVVFSNNGTGTGFESDNQSILASTVPEPSTYGMLMAGLSALGFVAFRRGARKL